MIRLLKIEWEPILANKSVKIMLGLYFGLFLLICLGIGSMKIEAGGAPSVNASDLGVVDFPGVWHNLTYLASMFNWILIFVVIMLVANEYTYKTLRQHVIDGLTRNEFLAGKIMSIGILSLVATVFVGLVIVILGFANSPPETIGMAFKGVDFMGGFFLQTFGYLILAFVIALILRKSILSLGLMVLYAFLIENLPYLFSKSSLIGYLPCNAMDNLIQNPVFNFSGPPQSGVALADVGATVAWTLVFILIAFVVLRKRDL